MSNGLEEEDDVFYGSKKKKAEEKPQQTRTSVYGTTGHSQPAQSSATRPAAQPAETAQVPEPAGEDRDIEGEITATRREKQHAAEIHDITVIRQKAAKHSAEAAKLFKKYRAEEAAMVKYTEGANKAKRVAEKYEQKAKDASAKAAEKQADVQYLEGRKAEKARVKVAKLHAKSAKLKSKASAQMAKAAKLSQKAAAKREKSKAYQEQSKTHEAEAHNYNKRADRLQKSMT